MTFKQFRNKPIVKFISNKYVIITTIFIVWMFFFDQARVLNHYELNNEINELEKSIDYFSDSINHDKRIIKNLKNPDSLEKFAREQYKMKKKNEDIYIIEFDTLKK